MQNRVIEVVQLYDAMDGQRTANCHLSASFRHIASLIRISEFPNSNAVFIQFSADMKHALV